MRNVLDNILRENQNTYFAFNDFFFFENRAVYEIMEKYSVAGLVTDDTMAHAHCMLDN
jgi:hypothetical protein